MTFMFTVTALAGALIPSGLVLHYTCSGALSTVLDLAESYLCPTSLTGRSPQVTRQGTGHPKKSSQEI